MTNQHSIHPTPPLKGKAELIHRYLVIFLHVIMGIELAAVLYEGHWIHAFLLIAISIITLLPIVLNRKFRFYIPAEFQILTIIFVFAALFLGEIHRYYDRWWWWDIALHGSSGLLLGIFGFLLVYVLNENERAQLSMRPRFIALFAFVFAVAVGALWEIFEFAVDQIFGANMQKPMLGDDSGLTDTMWDLIVDAIGALIISLWGWWYLMRRKRSFIEVWIDKFITRNPHLFRSYHSSKSEKD
ncbi:putative membrane protein DUF2238 [Nitrosomonas nitrosa]|jgi:uncharacterized membrane protein YjdF|uniref:DUF2238 domain-containing protein n=1 Tax=Nitrosomonas nitrosa TaxID=52442 RepID=A0A8H9D8Q2_9PROT|nr:DUF2238 domain-containing protein [Nitrosomonas nitrosa]PTQ96231.1 putative membrane protein DUF2238 [Nitrosomonas nitrosa]CAE6489521.1 conserved membrane hypothetical protein [Nitrosomonas nitrosa]